LAEEKDRENTFRPKINNNIPVNVVRRAQRVNDENNIDSYLKA